jgi:antirestriction protein ArdC
MERIPQEPERGEFQSTHEQPQAPIDESWDERVIREGIETAEREGGSIDDRTARYIASQLHGGQASALYSLASTGRISPDIDRELADGYDQQTDQARLWIRWLGGYCDYRRDKGSVPGWAERSAEQDRADEERQARAIDPPLLEAAVPRVQTGKRTLRRREHEVTPHSREHVYDRITDRIIKALEAGTVPWQKPWGVAKGRPRSMTTRKPYQGINVLLLGMTAMERGYDSPWWGTFKQIKELGGFVIRGQTKEAGKGSTTVVFYTSREREELNQETGVLEVVTFPIARAFQVFNAAQCESLPERFYPQPGSEEVLAEPQAVLDGYLTRGGPRLQHAAGDRAYYRGDIDTITMPMRTQFHSPAHYYSTAFHETGHSTGHPLRLNRPGIAEFDHFGSGRYAKEELVAQMSAAILLAETGIDRDDLFQNSAAYIQSWLGALQNDRSLVASAASHAQKAVDLITEPTHQVEALSP